MTNGDRLSGRRQLWEDLPDPLVVAELAVPGEQHDPHGGDLLGEGGQAVIGRGPGGDVPPEVGHPVSPAQDHPTVPDDHDARAGHGRPRVIAEERVHRWQVPAATHAAAGASHQEYDDGKEQARRGHREARVSSPAMNGAKYCFQAAATVWVPWPRVISLVGIRT